MSFNKFLSGLATAAVILAAGYVVNTFDKMNRACKGLDTTVNDLANRTEIDIPEALIERVAEKAVEKTVKRKIDTAASEAVIKVSGEMRTEIKKHVDSVYSDLKDSVTKEIRRQVNNLDIGELKDEVKEEAKEAALEKLNDSLDDILEKFNSELDNVGRIYSSIAESMSNRKETLFRIG